MEKSLTVVEQKEVLFYGDKILAVRVKDGAIFVPVRPICEQLGISWPSQRNRIHRDAVLSEIAANISVFVMNTQGQSQHREMLSLPLDFVSGFLFGINANRVKDELRERLIQYQRECYNVLAEAFFEGRLTQDTTFESLLEKDTPAVQAYKTFAALTKLARNQVLLEGRLDDHEDRLERIEATLGDTDRAVTPDQASQISQGVKAVAHAMGGHGKHYQSVYGELYRKEGITSYKLLPSHRFQAVMQWLSDWYRNLTNGTDVPF